MIGDARQLPLELPLLERYGREDFLVAESNGEALDWIDRPELWPGAVSTLVGPPGAGKTHLLRIFAAEREAELLGAESLEPLAERRGPLPVLALDDAGAALAGSGAAARVRQEAAFHLFNRVQAEGGSWLLADREAPARWELPLADLRSRLVAAPLVRLSGPDDLLIEMVLAKLFHERQLAVSAKLMRFLVPRMERSLAFAARLASEIDRLALARGVAPGIGLARLALARLEQDEDEASTASLSLAEGKEKA